MNEGWVRKFVRERYGDIAKKGSSCCGPAMTRCGGDTARVIGSRIGYSEAEMGSVPAGANLGLGCGNPIAQASLAPGETVLDLGSGAGFDCFLAARQVGPGGRVIGVDMTPEMIEKARENARRANQANVEFRLGEIEHLPLADSSVDAILSNCVVNLSPAKDQVFREAFRVLRPGGRLMISDIMLEGEIPPEFRDSLAAHAGCIGGAIGKGEYLRLLRVAGFDEVRVVGEDRFEFGDAEETADYARSIADQFGVPEALVGRALAAVVSVRIAGVKPPAS